MNSYSHRYHNYVTHTILGTSWMFITQAKHNTAGNLKQHEAWVLYVLADDT